MPMAVLLCAYHTAHNNPCGAALHSPNQCCQADQRMLCINTPVLTPLLLSHPHALPHCCCLTPTAMLGTSLPCSSSEQGFSTTTVCTGAAGRAPAPLGPAPPAPAGGCALGPMTGGAPAGVTWWHTEHLTLCAPMGYMSMMLQPPHTRCPYTGTCVMVWHIEHCTLCAPRGYDSSTRHPLHTICAVSVPELGGAGVMWLHLEHRTLAAP
mmetsp:Transcript_22962/g.58693  ORF Transcript_22962/g.58693 Transcript_22962/m.58693 type:complete len:209 (+) Transcript_22962:440-1066(+)